MVGRNLIEAVDASRFDIVAPASTALDLRNPAAVSAFFTGTQPDLIIHAAGRVGGIQANIAAPGQFLADNLRMGLNVLDAAMAVPGCRVLNLSSSCVYPAAAANPLTEGAVLTGAPEPTNEGYALAKIAVMRYGTYLNRREGAARIKSLIPCNIYGRHDSFAPAKSHLIAAAIAKIVQAQTRRDPAVAIWGDGSVRREFAFASDVAGWIWEAAARFDDLPETMNLGIGDDHSVLDYYTAIARVTGWSGRFAFEPDQPVGMRQKLVDNRHQRRLGFKPATTLEAGLRQTSDYYRSLSL